MANRIRAVVAAAAIVALAAGAARAQVASPMLDEATESVTGAAPPPSPPSSPSSPSSSASDRPDTPLRGVPSTASVSLGQSMPATDPAPDPRPHPGPRGRGVPSTASVTLEQAMPAEDTANSDPSPPAPAPAPAAPAHKPRDGAPALPEGGGEQRLATTEPTSPPANGAFDSATMRRIAERLVSLNLLAHAEDAQDPALLAEALRTFQANSGIAPTGNLDRDTAGRLLSS